MTVEELLKPRRKVMIHYPDSPFRIGDVLEMVYGDKEFWECCRTGIRYGIDVDASPEIFRKLEWWEERDVKDMPEYVKFQGKVCKIKEYVFKDWVTAFYTDDLKFGVIKHVDQTTPATEADYNEYIKAKTPQP